MRAKVLMGFVALSILAAVALSPAAFAGAQVDRATGGGQILTPSGNGGGAGSTLAFEAHDTGAPATNGSSPATGNLQFVDRSSGNVPQHGSVYCLNVTTNGSG